MSEPTPSQPVVEGPRKGLTRRISAAWLVPLAALAIALGVAYRTYSERGPMIEILFDSGEGITAGETRVKYKDFDVGLVESLDFTEDLSQVVAEVRLDAEIADFIDDSTQFWLVQAQVGPQGISGLQTVLSGAYIATAFDNQKGTRQTRFTALSEPPLTAPGAAGTRVILRAPQGGSVTVGAPVLYKRIGVGKVEKVDLSDAGDVVITAFIDSPNDDRLTTATRFWNASGFSVNLSSAGASLDVESLAALVRGGIAFGTVTSGGEPISSEHEYRLFSDENEARVVILNEDPGNALEVMTSFEGSVRGLQVGAVVQYRGIPVGEVSQIQAEVIRVGGEPVVSVRGTLTLNPSRFGIPPGEDPTAELLDLLEAGVENGLRARLATANILTGTLIVSLAEVPDAPPEAFDREARPYPEIPSASSSGDGLAETAEGLLARFESLPIEDLMNSITTLMASANRLITEPALQEAPANIGALIADLRDLVASSELREAPAELNAILVSARRVVDEISEQQVAENLSAALQSAAEAARNVEGATQNLPGLIDEITSVAAEVRGLPLEDTVAAATKLVNDIDAIVNSEQVAAIPASVEASLAEVRGMLEDVRTGGAIEDINATAASIRSVADELVAARIAEQITTILSEVEATAGEVQTASAGFPALMENVETVSANVAALPLDDLVTRAEAILASVEALIQSEGVAGLPPRVSAAVDDLRLIMADLVAGGAVDNVNATLASTRAIAEEIAAAQLADTIVRAANEAEAAAANISTASEDLPQLLDSLTQLSEKASALPLDQLVQSATEVLDSADAFLSSEAVASVPPELTATLAELRGTLEELREGGAVANLNATLASADRAADAITTAANELPALVAELSRVAAQADAALISVGPGSQINRDTLLLLRDVRNAAQSVNALVSALERRPNSILFGR